MQSPCFSCLPDPHNTSNPKSRSSTSECRHDFISKSKSSIFPNTIFTSRESLLSLQEAFSEFAKVYPQYLETHQIDHIRAKEYYHLIFLNYTCLNYIGTGLFSYSQLRSHEFNNGNCSASTSNIAAAASHQSSDHYPFFALAHRRGNLKENLLCDDQDSELEKGMKRRIMAFLNMSKEDYSMVFTANKTSAFKLLAESYPFQSTGNNLLTVYDYESEAIQSMASSSEKRGAKVMAAEFSWPRLRIRSEQLKKMITKNNIIKKKKGLFVFPLHSRITGSRYPYVWMRMAQENGWHIVADACSLGPKDMDSFGLSLFRPEFLICSFYKVFGENPSGFACLFVKKSILSVLEDSTSPGIVSLVSGKQKKEDKASNPVIGLGIISNYKPHQDEKKEEDPTQVTLHDHCTTSPVFKTLLTDSSIRTPDHQEQILNQKGSAKLEICRGLDQVDSLGMTLISNRGRYLINWLTNALTKLQHPGKEETSLVRIYGPKIRFDRGPALAFNIFDSKGEKIEPVLVQRLAERSQISLSYGFLHNIWFADKYGEEKRRFLERKGRDSGKREKGKKRDERGEMGIKVVSAAMGFLANFEDVYRLWSFVAKFLNDDFVEKERWRDISLDKKNY